MANIKKIVSTLNKINRNATVVNLSLEADKWIVFSDHHRGVGDGADDFAVCKQSYVNALNYYLTQDYGLIILGDVEEFWENALKSVISKYKDVLNLENQFHIQ